ncbi:MAG: SDR family oxidoreductase [Pseudomonadales bacterium]|jgi:NAD(P)-dependent dehydrogenase (short-subunit alcohol dehydrogenase family)
MSLEGKVVLVTGAGRGIGAGIARCFAARGALVAVTDLDDTMAADAAAALPTRAVGFAADASNQDAMRACFDRVIGEFGRLDVLVNNAGIGGLDIDPSELTSGNAESGMTDAMWDEQLRYNLRTTFASSNAAIPRLSDGGSIVNVASIAALGATPDLIAYGAAKAGVVHLTRSLALQLAPRRIRVNCICPGLLWTRAWELLTARMQANQPELSNVPQRQIFESVVAEMTPLGGEQTPEDIGNLAVFYASDEARMITGQWVAVDGGITLRRS